MRNTLGGDACATLKVRKCYTASTAEACQQRREGEDDVRVVNQIQMRYMAVDRVVSKNIDSLCSPLWRKAICERYIGE